MRRLFFDIETSFNLCAVWKTGYQITVPHDAIIKEAAIMCIAYKWNDQKKVYHLEWDSKQNDKSLLQKFIKISEQADELVGHNGDNFDLKWIRTRCFFHGISIMPNYTTIDTLKQARSGFRFNSNKLDYINKYIGGQGKNHTSFDLWKEIVLNKSKKSMKIMTDYCKMDVVILEEIFNRMSPYIKHKTSIADYKCNCPNCNSERMVTVKYRKTAAGTDMVQRQCRDCGKFNTSPVKTVGVEEKKREVNKLIKKK